MRAAPEGASLAFSPDAFQLSGTQKADEKAFAILTDAT
jgi:hypothetical protein